MYHLAYSVSYYLQQTYLALKACDSPHTRGTSWVGSLTLYSLLKQHALFIRLVSQRRNFYL